MWVVGQAWAFLRRYLFLRTCCIVQINCFSCKLVRAKMIEFCENNTSIFDAWENHGFTHCFMDSVSAIILFFLSVILGASEIAMYWRFGTHVASALRRTSKLYILHLTFCNILVVLPLVEVVVCLTVIKTEIYGHQWLRCATECVTWIFVLLLIYWERNYDLPSPPSPGILGTFWKSRSFWQNLKMKFFCWKIWKYFRPRINRPQCHCSLFYFSKLILHQFQQSRMVFRRVESL